MGREKIRTIRDKAVQIVCADPFCLQAYRRELEHIGHRHWVRSSASAVDARRAGAGPAPAVVLFDESAADEGDSVEALVALLTETAPVVVVAAPERQPEMAFLITSGAVDFVVRCGNFPSIAAGLVERRLRLAESRAGGLSRACEQTGEDFGEILRHEMNNPLTGILGNAELLLARRERMPAGMVQRVETIAELAVRLRETVRRLSDAWEERQDDPVHSA